MLDEIINWFGNQKQMAETLNISEAAISIWKREGGVPPLRAIEIEKISKGKFKAIDIVNTK